MQVYRLLGDTDLALEDLNSALRLCGGRGKVAEQAYCQRGLLYRLQESEDQARADFTAAARLGSKFAQKQVQGYQKPVNTTNQYVPPSLLEWQVSSCADPHPHYLCGLIIGVV